MTVVALRPEGSTLNSDRPLRVLNDGLRDRLAAAANAYRELTAAGFVVMRQDLLRKDKRPLMVLAAGTEELRSQLRGVMQTEIGGSVMTLGRYGQVDVCWPKAEQH